MKKFALLIAIALVVSSACAEEKYSDVFITHKGHNIFENVVDFIENPICPEILTINELNILSDLLGVKISSFDWFEPEEKHRVHVILYKESLIVAFERHPDGKILISRYLISNSEIPINKQIIIGMSKEKFCQLLGIPSREYMDEEKISIGIVDGGSGSTHYIFDLNDKLVSITCDPWFDDQVFIDQL